MKLRGRGGAGDPESESLSGEYPSRFAVRQGQSRGGQLESAARRAGRRPKTKHGPAGPQPRPVGPGPEPARFRAGIGAGWCRPRYRGGGGGGGYVWYLSVRAA